MSGLYLAARDGERIDIRRRRRRIAAHRDPAEILADAARMAKMAADAGTTGIAVLDRLWDAVRDKDFLAARALAREACIEIGASVQMTRNLSNYLAPPKSCIADANAKSRRA